MSVRDDDLHVRPGRIRDRGARARPKSFVTQVLQAAQKAGHVRKGIGSSDSSVRRSAFGRGRGVAFAQERLLDSSRRVIVKARVVRHRGRRFRSAPLSAHVAYLKREGVTIDGRNALMFDGGSDTADDKAFAERCKDDRHHFRLIVSPEDAAEMSDLKAFARDLMADMERDLGTRLDWIGVDHWNTDNPHVHLLLRGKANDGNDLVISRDYISRGIRARAEQLSTAELGPKSEREVQSALERDVGAERWTRLDSALRRQADGTGFVDLRPTGSDERDRQIRRLMIGRLQRLERMGLATRAGPAQWTLEFDAEATLRALAIRGDIIKTMHRAFAERGVERGPADYAIHEKRDKPQIVGRLVGKGLHDELTEEAFVLIDGVDGRGHHVRFSDMSSLEHAPSPGGIVELRRVQVQADEPPRVLLATRSDLAIAAQVTAGGATWLDYQLVAPERTTLASGGFGAEVREALEARIEHLIQEGLARRQGQRVVFASDLLNTLRRRELEGTAEQLASQTGRSHRPLAEGDSAAGIYGRRLNLASGRFAMIDAGLGFSLVPWRPALERRLGQHVSGLVNAGGGVDWDFARQRGLGI
jgi:type IV secretory pathway VirD2 relaxase